jgi:hypothetical protein
LFKEKSVSFPEYLVGKTEKIVGTFGLSKCPANQWRKNTTGKVLSH